MSDLPQISQSLPGFSFASNKSTWAEVKGLPDNVELEVADAANAAQPIFWAGYQLYGRGDKVKL